jgi:hypothetical protein
MLDTFRNKRMMAATRSAGIVGIATIIGSGVAAADPKATEVKLQNKSGVALEVTITDGDAMLKKKGSIEFAAGDARSIGTVPDGTTLKWVATPKRDDDKNRFTGCKGDKKVSGSKDTVVIEEKNCNKSSAATAAKTPANSAGGKVTIKLENTMDDVSVVFIRIRDLVDSPYSYLDVSSLKAKEISDLSNSIFARDKDGKFDIQIRYECYKGSRNRITGPAMEEYKGSETTIQFVKTKIKDGNNKEDECGLKKP